MYIFAHNEPQQILKLTLLVQFEFLNLAKRCPVGLGLYGPGSLRAIMILENFFWSFCHPFLRDLNKHVYYYYCHPFEKNRIIHNL
jgi:hypothetical protein